MVVRVDEGGEAGVVFDHEGIHNVGLCIEHSLDFLRIDVLTVRAENHALRASSDVEVSFGVDDTHVSCPEPAVFREQVGGRLRVLEISEGYIRAGNLDLSFDSLRIFGIDSYLHVQRCLAA